MIKSLRFVFLALFVALQFVAYGQPAERLVQVQVTPDHTNWLYKPGEKVKFKVAVLKCNIPQDEKRRFLALPCFRQLSRA